MKAMLYRSSGGPEVLEYTDVDDPVPGDGDVVVEVAATALNRLDLLQRNGWYHMSRAWPWTGGMRSRPSDGPPTGLTANPA